MTGGGWPPVEGDPPAPAPQGRSSPLPPDDASGDSAAMPTDRGVTSTTRITTGGDGRRRPVLLVATVAALIGIGIAAVTGRLPGLNSTADDPDPAPGMPIDDAGGTEQATRSEPGARRVFAEAVVHLRQARTWAYEGTVMGWSPAGAPVEVPIEGEVSLPRKARHQAHGPGRGIIEEVIVGPNRWARSAASADELAAAPWNLIYQGSDRMGMTQLPTLLRSTTGRLDGGIDADGNRRARAAIPDGQIEGLLSAEAEGDGEVVLTVDDEGVPLVVELTTATPESGDVTLTWHLLRLGEPVEIDLPPGMSIELDHMVSTEDLAAAGIHHPVGLHGLPPGWIPVSAEIDSESRPRCPILHLVYRRADSLPGESGILMSVNAPECAVPDSLGWDGEPVTLAGLHGEIGSGGGGTFGRLRSDQVAVQFSMDLPRADAETVLATLGPLDLTRQPEPIDGLSAPPG
jgi:hypothetical protein